MIFLTLKSRAKDAALGALLLSAIALSTPLIAADSATADQLRHSVKVTRLLDRPIISPDTDPSIGSNIQGPSLIKVPDWVSDPLGKYYLYFADHKGQYIRLAYADEVTGPWKIHVPGSLRIEESFLLYRGHRLHRNASLNLSLLDRRAVFACLMTTRKS